MKFEKIVDVGKAFDKRDPNPSKNYGVGACKINFILKGEKGAVQFMIGTNWYPFHIQKDSKFKSSFFEHEPKGWDVGYHSPKPMYEDQTPVGERGTCPHLGKEDLCYYDGSSLRADEWVEPFIMGGTDWLWPKLEEEYKNRFE